MSESRSTLGWGHINVNVSSLEASITFYEKLGFTMFVPGIPYLGLTSVAAAPVSNAGALGLEANPRARACIMQLGSSFPKLDLTEITDDPGESPPSNRDLGIVRFCLASRDLQGDYNQLRKAGVNFLTAPETCAAEMADIAVCMDPDGTLIELIQVHLDRWPRLGK